MIPGPWYFALIALAGFRLWRFIGDDGVLDRQREWVLVQFDKHLPNRSGKLDYFITCPWCAGFWEVGIAYVCWMLTPFGEFPDSAGEWLAALGVWWALSAVVGYLGVTIDVLEDQKK